MRALVTGSARGIGRAIAVHLAGSGFEVAVHYRSSREQARKTVAEIEHRGGTAHLVSGDVTRPDQVEAMAQSVRTQMGGLEVLINNVGDFHPTPFAELTVEQWDRQIASTVSATFYVSKAMLPLLTEGGGRIINISDSRADRIVASPRSLPYQVGKTGVLILTKTMARTEARRGVTVNAILPGVLENSQPPGDPEIVPAGRLGTYADILAAVDFLVGSEAEYITGSFLQVGGGWNL